MSDDITIAETSLEADAAAIADIYQDRQPTRISRPLHGTVEPAEFQDGLEKMFAASLRDADHVLYVARDAEDKIVSYINLARKPALVLMDEEVGNYVCYTTGCPFRLGGSSSHAAVRDIGKEEGSRKLRKGGDAGDERAAAHRAVGAAGPGG